MTTSDFYQMNKNSWTCPCCHVKMLISGKRTHVQATIIKEGGRKICINMPEHPRHGRSIKRKVVREFVPEIKYPAGINGQDRYNF